MTNYSPSWKPSDYAALPRRKALHSKSARDRCGIILMSALTVLCRYRHKRRTQEAYGTLKPISERFPEEWLMGYNMACYACQLGNQDEARHWLELAYKRGDKSEIRKMARVDPDLAPLRARFGEI